MNRVESFALQAALKISEPFIENHFYPTVDRKYITFHSHGEEDSRNYSHLQEVIDILQPILNKKGIKIYQLGAHKDISIGNCRSFLNQTSINQCSYLVKNSLLHFGVDSFLLHVASFHKTPIVGLYSNKPKEISRPLWNKEFQILIESFDEYPSYAAVESPKTINRITPESVCAEILDALNIPHKLKSYKTLNIGELYYNPVFEIVPDFVPSPEFFPNTLLNVRLDFEHNPDMLQHFCRSNKSAIFIAEEIDLNYILQFKPNIERINVDVDKLSNVDYINKLKYTGIYTALFSKDKDNINKIRRDFFDWRVELVNQKTKKDLDSEVKKCDNVQYKSRKLTFSKGKTYLSKAAWKKGIEKQESNFVIDSPTFWEELDHFYIFKNHEKKVSNP